MTVKDLPEDEEIAQVELELMESCDSTTGDWAENMVNILACASGSSTTADCKTTLKCGLDRCILEAFKEMSEMDIGRAIVVYSWIEPQNIMGSEVLEYNSGKHCSIVYVPKDNDNVETKLFENLKGDGKQDVMNGTCYMDYTLARRNVGLAHFRYSKKSGLEFMIPRQLKEEAFMLYGARVGHMGDFENRSINGDCLDDYMWTHGCNGLSGVGESILYESGMAMDVHFSSGGSFRNGKTTYFEGQMSDLEGSTTLSGTRPCVTDYMLHPTKYETCVCRNRMLMANGSLNAAAVHDYDGLIIPICSTGTPLLDKVEGDYLRSKPMRLIVKMRDESMKTNVYAAMDDRITEIGVTYTNMDVGQPYLGREYHMIPDSGNVNIRGQVGTDETLPVEPIEERHLGSSMPIYSTFREWTDTFDIAEKDIRYRSAYRHVPLNKPASGTHRRANLETSEVTEEVRDKNANKVTKTTTVYKLEEEFDMETETMEALIGLDYEDTSNFLSAWENRITEDTDGNGMLMENYMSMFSNEHIGFRGTIHDSTLLLLDMMCVGMAYDDMLSQFIAMASADNANQFTRIGVRQLMRQVEHAEEKDDDDPGDY
jgi:hypothetical protein